MKKFIRLGVLFFLIVEIFSFSCFASEAFFIREATKRTSLTGYTRSKTTVTLSSEVSGKLIAVNYDVGETLGKKPFFEIDPTFIDFQIQRTRRSIKKLDIEKKKQQSNVAYLEKEFKRIDTLHKGDRATEVKWDAARESLDQALLELESIDAEKASVEITLNELTEKKERHQVFGPDGWVVVRKNAEVGEIVNSGTPLAMAGDYRQLVVPLSVSGEEYAALRKLPDTFQAALENQQVGGSIHWVNPEFDEKTRKLSLELILSGYNGEKRGGLRFTIPVQIESEGLLVPRAAVTSRYENPRVTIKSSGETVAVIVIGESDDNLIIAEDDRLKVGMELAAK